MVNARDPIQSPTPGRAPATYLLILAQAVVWMVVRRYLLPGNAWAGFAIRPGALDEVGLIISPFIHLEPAHLGVNLLALWLFGTNLERAVGSLRFLFLYLGAAWFASLMHWAVATSFHLHSAYHAAAIGSSGAVAGILGAAVVRFPQARLGLPLLPRLTFPTAPILTLWLVYTLVRALVTTVSGVTEGVGHWAHLAGFIFGLGIAQLSGLQRQARLEFLEQAARTAGARNDLVGAAQAWSALLAMRPRDLKVRTSLVATRLALNDLAGARRLAREGIETLVRADERELALDAYLAFYRLIPELALGPGIRYRLGCWLADRGEAEAAFAALLESVREDGAAAAAACSLYRAGQVAWEKLRSPRRARDTWQRLLEQFPDSPWSEAAREGLRRAARAC